MYQNMKFFKVYIFFIIFQTFGTDFGTLPVEAQRRNIYKPLQIFPYFRNLEYELDEQEGKLLKHAVNNVILYLKKILSVIPEKGHLLLERKACRTSWTDGRNAGKCAQIRKDYVGEFCLDDFMIPDEHLEAFYTWTNKPLPDKTWFTDGKGVRNFDYILYVQAMTTPSCMKSLRSESSESSLIAYASYCKLGKNDRPLAGYINFCSSEFRKYKNDRNKLMLVTLHELFHALGFSKDLFMKFRDGRQLVEENILPHYSFQVLRNVSGGVRLLTPTVVDKMNEQFGCSVKEFEDGVPLVVQNGVLQSHWDEKVLPGSIMLPKIGKPELTFVDPITLALFQDTGWYSVNFSNGDNYLWGRGKGCDYLKDLISKKFHVSDYIECQEGFTSTCNFYQTEITNCGKKNASVISTSIMDCRLNSSTPFMENTVKSSDVGRCIHYQSNMNINGRCVTARCSLGHAWIKLKPTDTNWIKCPFGEEVDDYENGGIITCPSSEAVFCYERQFPIYLQDLVSVEATTVTDGPRVFTYPVTQSNFYSVHEHNADHDKLPSKASSVKYWVLRVVLVLSVATFTLL